MELLVLNPMGLKSCSYLNNICLFYLMAIVLSVFLLFTASDYPFDIVKLFLIQYWLLNYLFCCHCQETTKFWHGINNYVWQFRQWLRVKIRVIVFNPLSTIFQLYRGGQFYWWMKPEYPEKTTDLPQIADKNLITKCCIEYTSLWTGFELNVSGYMHWLHM